jgi:phosphate/sulfate permease
MFSVYFKDPLRASVEAASGGKRTVIYDDKKNPSIMYDIPKFKNSDIDSSLGTDTHPAFIWVPFVSFLAIGLGTMSGGWKIVKTMGTRITKVTPLEGVSAETAGAITLFLTDHLGIPVSTTHTITGSIIGVGLTKRVSAVRWGVTISLLWAWIITIPISAVIAALCYLGVIAL